MSSFLEDIEFASKVNEALKDAEKRGIDNSIELTKKMIKQQYKDTEKLKKALKNIKEYIEQNSLQFNDYDGLYSFKTRGKCLITSGSLVSSKSILDIVNKALGDKQ